MNAVTTPRRPTAFNSIWSSLKDTIDRYSKDNVPTLAAALSYYTIFSVAPLLIITIAIVGFVYGREAAQGQISQMIEGTVGHDAAQAVQTLIVGASTHGRGVVATIIGVGLLLIGASGVLTQLVTSLNLVWSVVPKPEKTGAWKTLVRERLFSFAMVLSIGFLLLVSLVLSAALSVVGTFMSDNLPGGHVVWQVINFCISVGVITGLFALMYKLVPDVNIAWRDVGYGAFFTAILFTVGKLAIGLYLGHSGFTSSYGAAGSFLVFVAWVYYSSQVVLIGAEFTRVYAEKRGSVIEPKDHAVRIPDQATPPPTVPGLERRAG